MIYFMMKLMNNWGTDMAVPTEDHNRDEFYDPEYFAHFIIDIFR